MKSDNAGEIRIEGEFLHTPDIDEKAWLDQYRPGWDKDHQGQLKVNLQNEIAPLDISHVDNVLNLNHKFLMANRAAVIKAIQTSAKRQGGQRAWRERMLTKFSTMSERVDYLNPATNQMESFMGYPPYRSIAIYYIRKKLKQF